MSNKVYILEDDASITGLVRVALEMSGMTVIDPKDAKFDPNTQQAIAMVPAVEGKSAGDVAQVFQHGWKIHERVLRPAMVSVVQG